MYYSDFIEEGTYLAHHGIKGQKWGVRRYQNPDGSLTAEGKKRYNNLMKQAENRASKLKERLYVGAYNELADKMNGGLIKKYNDNWIKKHGNNDFYNPDYTNGYYKICNKIMREELNRAYDQFIRNTPEYKKASKLMINNDKFDWPFNDYDPMGQLIEN